MADEFGLTAQGFKRKTYPDILESMQARAGAFFGEDVNLSERSPLGLFIQVQAWEVARLWEEAENVYYAGYIDDAEGVQLDSITKYAVPTRKGPQYAKGYILATGNEGAEITPAFIAGTKTGIYFRPDTACILGTEPTRVNVSCLDTGKVGNVPAETITEIITPLAGVSSITNPEPTADGEDVETDPEFRERYYRSLSSGGSSTSAAVEAALLNMPIVIDAVVKENDTIETKDGIPPKSLAPYVFGGDDTEVAKTILAVKAAGIQSFGATVLQVEDDRGYVYAIGFTRPTTKDIYVRLQITKGSIYPSNGDDLAKTAVIKYIGGVDVDGVDHLGLRLGADVILSKIISAINVIAGVSDVSVALSTDGTTFIAQNIEIAQAEIAVTDPDLVVFA